MLAPDIEVAKEEIEQIVQSGFIKEDLEKYKQDFEEAVATGGEDAVQYLAAKEGLQDKLSTVLSEEKAQGEASYWAGMAIKDYQVVKDAGGYDGNFEEFANQYFALNRLRILNYAQMNEKEADEIWKERLAETQQMSDEERYREESGRGILFSKSVEEEQQDEIQQKAFAKDVQTVIKEAEKKEPSAKVKAGFGAAKKWLVTVSKRLGLDVEGYKHIVDANGVRHIKLRHGEGNEIRENQIPVTNQDIENIPNIVNTPDYLVYGTKTDSGRDGVGYLKTMPDGSTYYVEEVWDNEKQLAAKTMYKIEGVTAEKLVQDSFSPTSETTPSAVTLVDKLKKSTVIPAFTKNIASGNINVKEDNKLYSKSEEVADINTPEFKEWFGDSKVVDADGKPLVVYHGSEVTDIEVFDNVYGRRAIFFTDNTDVADTYSLGRKNYPVYLSMKKPFIADAKGRSAYDLDIEFNGKTETDIDNLAFEIKKSGKYDGFIIKNIIDESGKTDMKSPAATDYAVFNPNQIKSVNNRGTFDKNDPNILHSEDFGSYDLSTKVVELMAGHNPSTLTHELSHHFFISHIRLMEEMGLNDRNKPVFDWLSKKGGHEINSVRDIKNADWENMTEAFIEYMNTNEAPNLATKSLFQRAKEWLLDNYRIHRTEASPEIRDYFDSLITKDTAMPDVSALTNQV